MEGISLSLSLFGQPFNPGTPGTYVPVPGYTNAGQVNARIFDSNDAYYRSFGLYPEGRFTDNTLHWVEFQGFVTRMDLSVVTAVPQEGPGIVAVPEASAYGILAAGACSGLGLWRRRRMKAA